MKRTSLVFTLLAAISFFMVSCGGSNAPKAEKTAAPAVEETETVVEQVAPEGSDSVKVTEVEEVEEVAVAPADLANGKAVYDKACFACHGAGIAGAAKLTDKARWETTAAEGIKTVDEHAIKGFTGTHGVMPAKGGNTSLTDQEVKDAVAYMLNTAGVSAK